MGNIFTIKHGEGNPDKKLQPFELGFDSKGKKLYIGGEKDADGTLGSAIPITPTLSDLGITASAAELNKMKGVTATTAEINILNGLTATTEELNYCKGVTSAIQEQLKNKQASITGAATTIASNNLTASRALVSNSSGKVGVSAVSSTELGYLSGVTSAIQTQLNGKQASITGAATTIASSNLTASRALVSNNDGKVAVSTVTSTELGYLDGVTGAIQTQLDSTLKVKLAEASPSGNSSIEIECDGQPYFVFAKINSTNITGAWDLAQSGVKNSMYGEVGNLTDNWPTTVDFGNNKIKITRNGATVLDYNITIFYIHSPQTSN